MEREWYLVLSLQHEQIGDFAKGKAEGDDLCFVDVIGQLADMYNSGRGARTSDVTFELLAVVAVGCVESRWSGRVAGTKRNPFNKEIMSQEQTDPTCWAHDIGPTGNTGEQLVRSSLKKIIKPKRKTPGQTVSSNVSFLLGLDSQFWGLQT